MSAKYFKFSVLFTSFISLSLVLGFLYIFVPNIYQSIDNRIRDFFFIYRGETSASKDIVIIDIDEKSLKKVGQWPWERKHISSILHKLTDADAGIIGLDIIFAEADKTSPHRLIKTLNLDAELLKKIPKESLINYDDILSKSLANTPSILGYLFDFDSNISTDAPQIPAIFIEKSFKGKDFLFTPKGTLLNIDTIQNSAYSSGYLNNVPDTSGMIRSLPLVMKFDETIYPSLSFEIVRLISSTKKVYLKYNNNGVEYIKIKNKVIPTDRFARLHINYKGPSKTYKYISAIDILNDNFKKEDISNKVILIGTSAYGLLDLRSTPLDSIMPGVEIHATVIDNILNQQVLYKPNWIEGLDLLITISLAAFIILILSYFPIYISGTMVSLLVPFILYIQYIILFKEYIILNIIFPLISIFTASIVMLIIKYFFEYRQKEKIKGKFAQKVSPQVMHSLIDQENIDHLHTRNKNVTIYFSDIRSFTTISENMESPEKLVEFLNFYMTEMAEGIISSKGTIDKFIGDAIMAYWNAPIDVDNHADEAVRVALEHVQKRDELNTYTLKKYNFELDYGIGLNTGKVTVGDIGSEGRSDYTIIGDPVNLAARLESLCKFYGVRLIISEFTKQLLNKEYICRELDWVKVKGKTEPVRIYEVISTINDSGVISTTELEQYQEALYLVRLKNFSMALKRFNSLDADNPHKLYKLYIQRCEYLMENPQEDFDGVFEFNFK